MNILPLYCLHCQRFNSHFRHKMQHYNARHFCSLACHFSICAVPFQHCMQAGHEKIRQSHPNSLRCNMGQQGRKGQRSWHTCDKANSAFQVGDDVGLFESASMRRHWNWLSAEGFWVFNAFFFRATELKDFIVRDVFLDSQVYPLQPGARNMSCFATIARPNNKTYSQQTISQQLPTISNISNQQFGHPVINDKSKTNISGEVQVAPHEPPSHWSCHGPDEGGRLRKHQHNEQWNGCEHLGWYAIYTVRTILWI